MSATGARAIEAGGVRLLFVAQLLLPLVATLLGAVAGFTLGVVLVTRLIGYASGLGANDLAGVACAGVLLAAVLGRAGLWVGDRLARLADSLPAA